MTQPVVQDVMRHQETHQAGSRAASGDGSYQAGKGQLPDEQLCGALVLTNLLQRAPARFVAELASSFLGALCRQAHRCKLASAQHQEDFLQVFLAPSESNLYNHKWGLHMRVSSTAAPHWPVVEHMGRAAHLNVTLQTSISVGTAKGIPT